MRCLNLVIAGSAETSMHTALLPPTQTHTHHSCLLLLLLTQTSDSKRTPACVAGGARATSAHASSAVDDTAGRGRGVAEGCTWGAGCCSSSTYPSLPHSPREDSCGNAGECAQRLLTQCYAQGVGVTAIAMERLCASLLVRTIQKAASALCVGLCLVCLPLPA